MNTKGFTLIELLAVVIILALLALLTSTAVTKLVKDSKDELSETQIKLIESAAKTWGADNLDKLPSSGECSYLTLSDLKEYGLIDSKVIDARTNQEISDDLKIKLTTTTNSYGNPITTYEVNASDVSSCSHNLYKKYENGEVVYFDVSNGKACKASDYTESQSYVGVKTGCMKFYAFNDSSQSKNVNLLLDHNTTVTIAWTTGSARSGPNELLTQLKSDTSSWLGTNTPDNYNNSIYTVDYSDSKARLITANEVAQIVGNSTWNETANTESFYLDSKSTTASDTCKSGNITGCKYGWLYDRTSTTCKEYGCYNNSDTQSIESPGYWTSSTYPLTSVGANICRYVSSSAALANTTIGTGPGVRPVIEVSKANL